MLICSAKCYQRAPTPLSILAPRTRLLLLKVHAFVDFFAAALDSSAAASLILLEASNLAPVCGEGPATPLRGVGSGQGFLAHPEHHPPEATLLPAKMLQPPRASVA